MAAIGTFKCKDCGYQVNANGKGYDGFFSGMVGWYVCDSCKEVVELPIPPIAQDHDSFMKLRRFMKDICACPECKSRHSLRVWTSRTRCPKCNGKMESPENFLVIWTGKEPKDL